MSFPLLRSLLSSILLAFATQFSLAQISPVSNGNWQDASIWPGAQLPGNSDQVLIPSGFSIGLTGTITVKSITIEGSLSAIDGSTINLQTEWIMVMGSNALFEIGSAGSPFNSTCTITLSGVNDGEDVMGMGDKLIGAMNGANIEFHGQSKVSWSQLGSTALPGATQITMANPVDWLVGDEIVIVSSRLDWEEAEEKTIAAISPDGLTITLGSALQFPHVGEVNTYARSTDNKTWTADIRAEVGLLTHNVKVQGDASSTASGYGGHIMCMPNSTINASGIELYRMGQKGELGRYPWHWHHVHLFGAGQSFKNSSVHHSFNRGITIHGTSHVTVENNFFYDHIGHGIFLEDGSERFNTIKNNVVLLSKRPAPGEELTPSDNEKNEVQNRTPASFWITNPNNYFEGNVAAGTQGTGYWFALPQSPMGSSAGNPIYDGIEPYKEPLGLFRNNKAHSCMSGFDIFDQLHPDHSIRTNAGWQNSDQHLIEGCTWYSNDLGIYSGIGGAVGSKITYTTNLIFSDNVFVENETNMQLASYSQVQESVIVALGTLPASYLYRIYDGAGQIRDCHLVGWNGNSVDYLRDGGAATKHTNHRLSGITTDDGQPVHVKLRDYDIPIANDDITPQNTSLSRVWNIVLYDEDGSFSGIPNSSIVSNHPFMLVGDEDQPAGYINAYRSPHKFALSLLSFPGLPKESIPNLTCTRTKAETPTKAAFEAYGYKSHIHFPFIVNEGFLYSYQFETLPTTKSIDVVMDDAEAGDTYLLRFKDFGKLGALSMVLNGGAMQQYTNMTDLQNSGVTAYFNVPNGDLFVKYIATQHLQSFNINWSTDFSVPILDTDRDGTADRDEIAAGTDPFEDLDSECLSVTKVTTNEGGFADEVGRKANFGASAAFIGDVNGDGNDDMIVGAPNATVTDNNGKQHKSMGAVWVLFLDETAKVIDQNKITAFSGGFAAGSLVRKDLFGSAVCGVGDFDSDGIPDVVVGAKGSTPIVGGKKQKEAGALWLMSLNADGTVKQSVKLDAQTESAIFSNKKYRMGASVAATDVNGDGITDLLVGLPGSDRSPNAVVKGAGEVQILYLNIDGTVASATRITAAELGSNLERNERFGSSITLVDDGRFAVGSTGSVPVVAGRKQKDAGAVWIIDYTIAQGQAAQLTNVTRLAEDLFNFGTKKKDFFGAAVSPVGDLDNDGTIDIAVGASGGDLPDRDAGMVYKINLNPDGTVKAAESISMTTDQLGRKDQFGAALAYASTSCTRVIAAGATFDDNLFQDGGAVWMISATNTSAKHHPSQPQEPADLTNRSSEEAASIFDETANAIKFYPNPFTDQLQLEIDLIESADLHIEILNFNGIQVAAFQSIAADAGKRQYDFDLQRLRAGCYFLRLRVGNELRSFKLVKVE